ncbi:UDP binding domain-containing protein [Denitrificimonas sp. JX-1]|uniref:UDP binding domain-containing protein n=1 Tax=Denitrificimonas halotolerans TaxID=3098930 RepID=A0ABU5GPC7_9GAMM|nr:UDP binding domain-containing protein [Denitrificimonas sp. JX-1]MDY7218798.1 UDP binding domain-containing protein [Denitrificimonas sp. JX-1]
MDVFDPWVNPEEAKCEYNITPVSEPKSGAYDAVVLAVGHHQFKSMGVEKIRKLGKPEHILYDLKYLLNSQESDIRL